MFAGRKKKIETPDTSVVVVAAGSASRMGGMDKQLVLFGGAPVLIHTLQRIGSCPSVREIIVVTREQSIPVLHQMVADFGLQKIRTIVTGGQTRQQSVRNGFREISAQSQFVAIHDGARPLVRPEDVEACIAAARESGAATLGVQVKDTIKQVDESGKIVSTPDRSVLYAAQTPQVFSVASYGIAAEKADIADRDFTDDCQLMEYAGMPVRMVKGSYDNIKITTPEDLAIAEGLLAYQCGWEDERDDAADWARI